MKTKLLRKIRLRARKMVSLSFERDDNNPYVLKGYRVVWSKRNRFKSTRYHTAFFEVKNGCCKNSEIHRIHRKATDFASKKNKRMGAIFFMDIQKEI